MWYTRSVPEMGFYVQERRFGFYQRQKDTGRVRATVRHLPAEDVPRFIEDLREYSGEQEITFHVDDGDPATIDARIDEMCRRLLANPVIERYRFRVVDGPEGSA